MKRIWLLVAVAVLAAVLVYPWETLVVPEWRARVVDASGSPIKGAKISESWQHYSVETRGHSAEAWTDEEGYVAFPSRVIRASLLMRAIGPVRNILRTGIHASFGRTASLIIVESGYDSTGKGDWWEPGRPLLTEVIVKKTK